MKTFVALLALVGLCQAGPAKVRPGSQATFFGDVDSYIIGGSNAAAGAWPWQLSQQRSGSHSCGASLLNSRYALSAAHCVDGAAASSLNVIAGLHDRTNTAGTQQTGLTSFTIHSGYDNGQATFANDIAILNFAATISANGGNIAFATLPASNSNDYAGSTCVITGWGRTSASNTLPNVLQQASIGIISSSQCQSQIGAVGTIWASHICVYDSANTRGACNGDSGGPVNCPNGGGYLVAGVASFVLQSGGACQPSAPSVYTRVSAYLSWISQNTP